MCLVLLVNESVASTGPRRLSVSRRTHWLRLFALLIALLGLSAQQRVLTPTVRPNAPVARLVAERVQSIETHAVPAQSALRVAAAPVFARVPWFSEPSFDWPQSGVRAGPALLPADPSYVSLSHFHSKRRIPRMNSEEPPRA